MHPRIANSGLFILDQFRADRRAVGFLESLDRVECEHRDAVAIVARAELADYVIAQPRQPPRDAGVMFAVALFRRLEIRVVEVELRRHQEALLTGLAIVERHDDLAV